MMLDFYHRPSCFLSFDVSLLKKEKYKMKKDKSIWRRGQVAIREMKSKFIRESVLSQTPNFVTKV